MKNINLKAKELYFKDLAVQAQSGDEMSYRELLLNLSPILRNFIFKHLFNHDFVEDILQDTLMAVHKALHTYNAKHSFLTWVFAICRHKLIDNIRKYQRIYEKEIKNDEFIATFASPNTNIEQEEVNQELEQALNKLPLKYKQVVVLLKLKENSVKQVAKELKMSQSNVKTIAHRAYKKLREFLKEVQL